MKITPKSKSPKETESEKLQRSHYSNELNPKMTGQAITIAGWVQRIRRLGKISFLLVRDREGITQCTLPHSKSAPELLEMLDKFSKREREIYDELVETLPNKKNSADQKLLEAFAVEMATYEEACENLAFRKVTKRGTGGEMPSPWVAIRNQAIKNAQGIVKLLGISDLAKYEAPVAKVTKLELLKNGKKKIQKTGT